MADFDPEPVPLPKVDQLTRDERDYLFDLEEWFADQTARWLTSNEKPVTAVDKRTVGEGRSGPVFERLMGAWSESVGVAELV